MKHKYRYIFIALFLFLLCDIKGQDTIRLKNGVDIPALIIQMDSQNVYYKKWDAKGGDIQYINKKKYAEVIFKSYPKSKLDSLLSSSKSILRSKPKKDTTLNKTIEKTLKSRPFAINFNILPVIDISAEYDMTSNSNLEFGLGTGYFYTGVKYYLKNNSNTSQLSAGMYLYRFKLFSKTSSTRVYMAIGYNNRSERGLNLKIEIGVLYGYDSIIPMPKIGFGIRF